MNRSPLVDVATLNAVASNFNPYATDPWAKQQTAKFAELFIYSDSVRFPVIRRSNGEEDMDQRELPRLVNKLRDRDSASLKPEIYSAKEPVEIKEEHLLPMFEAFSAYAQNNRSDVQKYATFLHQEEMLCYHSSRKDMYSYPVQPLRTSESFRQLTSILGIDDMELCRIFEMVLRYSLYGSMAGEGNIYLAHPLRERQTYPILEQEAKLTINIPVPIGRSVARLVSHLTQDEFISLLHEARGVVREMKIVHLKPSAVGKEARRELAERLKLPARLKDVARGAGVLTALIGGAGAFPSLGPGAAVAGMLVSMATMVWNGTLPGGITSIRWVRCALEYDIENDTDKAD